MNNEFEKWWLEKGKALSKSGIELKLLLEYSWNLGGVTAIKEIFGNISKNN